MGSTKRVPVWGASRHLAKVWKLEGAALQLLQRQRHLERSRQPMWRASSGVAALPLWTAVLSDGERWSVVRIRIPKVENVRKARASPNRPTARACSNNSLQMELFWRSDQIRPFCANRPPPVANFMCLRFRLQGWCHLMMSW